MYELLDDTLSESEMVSEGLDETDSEFETVLV